MLRAVLIKYVKLSATVKYSNRLCYSSWTKFDLEDEDKFDRKVKNQYSRSFDSREFNKRNKQDGFSKRSRNDSYPRTRNEPFLTARNEFIQDSVVSSAAAKTETTRDSSTASTTDDKDDRRKAFMRPVQDIIDSWNSKKGVRRNRFNARQDYELENSTQIAARPTREEVRAKYAAAIAKLPPSQTKIKHSSSRNLDNANFSSRQRLRSNVRHFVSPDDELFNTFEDWKLWEKRIVKTENATDNASLRNQDELFNISTRPESLKTDQKTIVISLFSEKFGKDPERRALSSDEWQHFYENAKVALNGKVKCIPAVLMESFTLSDAPGTRALAKSLYDYEQQLNEAAWFDNMALQVLYMRVISDTGGDESEILPLYDRICQKTNGLLDYHSAELAFIAIARTSRWQTECPRLLEMIGQFKELGPRATSAWIEAHARNGDKEQAESLLVSAAQRGKLLMDDLFRSLLQLYGSDWLLRVLAKSHYIMAENVARLIADHAASEKMSREWIRVNKGDPCSSCSAEFDNIKRLTLEEFETLRAMFMERVMVRRDIFINTSPEELAAFQSFLRGQQPFDFVVDALNVSYITKWRMNTRQQATLLTWVVEYLASRGRRVLVLGRRHMEKWPRDVMARMSQSCQVFNCDNVSMDDPFTLYAALHSGPNTMVVTRDELRDHKFRLGKELAGTFLQWQRTQQLVFRGIYRDREQRLYLSIRWPNGHETCVQETPTGWHVPYENNEPRLSFEPPNSWLCLQKTAT